MGHWGDRGGCLMASRGWFLGHGSWLQFCDESMMAKASILLPNRHDFRHDRATIAPRSGRDRGPNPSSIACRSIGDDSPTRDVWLRLDRAAIAARSDRDRGFFHVLSLPSDSASSERMIVINLIPYTTIIGSVRRQPSDEFLISPRWKSGAPGGTT